MTTERQQEAIVSSTLEYLDKLWKNAPKDVVKITTGVQIGDNVKRVSVKMPEEFGKIEIIHITDVQFGHILCNVAKFVEYRDWILRSPYRFVLFGGDMVDAATILSKGSPYENTSEPKTQMMRFCEIAMPMRHRVLGYVGGNHEAQSVKTYGTLGSTIATFLRIPYSDGKQLIDIHFGNHKPFPISMFHGAGSARTKGAKAQMLHRFMQSADSLLYLVGHLHDAITLWHWRERRTQDNRIHLQKTCGMMSSSFLEYYGSYAERMGLDPTELVISKVVLYPEGQWEVHQR